MDAYASTSRARILVVMPADLTLTRAAVVTLYTRLLEAWNSRDAATFAAQFTSSGSTVGFDGSQLDGRDAIRSELTRIFADHVPATYVAKVREVRPLVPGAMLLRGVAGMVPPGQSTLMAERNAVQSLVAVLEDGEPRIAMYQNTPARFDGRPRLGEQLTAELTAVHRARRIVDAG
jgi:uncharacterized protein (TIGR02246 family)